MGSTKRRSRRGKSRLTLAQPGGGLTILQAFVRRSRRIIRFSSGASCETTAPVAPPAEPQTEPQTKPVEPARTPQVSPALPVPDRREYITPDILCPRQKREFTEPVPGWFP